MRNKLGAAYLGAAMMAMMAGGMPGGSVVSRGSGKSERPCLRCGTPHLHNNSFCSAECCRLWAAERKQRSRCQQTNNSPMPSAIANAEDHTSA
jgi:hypothetical protein